jgi:hypothetical protein
MKLFKDSKNTIWAFEPDGSQDHLIKPDMVSITKEQADKIISQKQISEFNALSYVDKRAAEYPSIPDQLDLIFHGGIDAWRSTVQAVKDKYPKG